ncbi:hypothetical protein XENORESO_009788 [Xenotaenia resolanae]|uniref:Uncharacterized protein n=1 Tax=Xenotaenia resolanae TaxID=208358 RepID=A0ABV0WSW4_9TELE
MASLRCSQVSAALLCRLNVVQQEKEMTENILTVASYYSHSSVCFRWLIRVSLTEAHVFLLAEEAGGRLHQHPGRSSVTEGLLRSHPRTLDLLGFDAATNRETKSWTAWLRISADELHC